MPPCLACLRPIQGLTPGLPPVCGDCWAAMTPADRARIMSDEQTRDLLRKMLDRLDADWTIADNLTQIGRISKAAENIAREAKAQSNSVDDLHGDVLQFLKFFKLVIEGRDKGDDDEPWRESLGDSDG